MLDRAASTERSMGLTLLLGRVLSVFGIRLDPSAENLIRKLAHFIEFGALGAELTALYCVLRIMSRANVSGILFAGLFASCVDEYIQYFSGRASMISDVFLDFAGFIAGVIAVAALRSIHRARDKGRSPRG